VTSGPLSQNHSTNFLRVYYSDFLAAGPTDPPVGRDERTVNLLLLSSLLLSSLELSDTTIFES